MLGLGFSEGGGPEVLRVVDVPDPQPRDGQVRIRVKYAAVNPTDIGVRRSGGAGLTGEPPWIAGMDAAGVVDSAPGVDDLPAGTEVMAIVVPVRRRTGAQAQFAVVPRESVVPVPSGMSLAAASTLPMNAMTSHFALAEMALVPGSCVAVTGGAGLLSSYFIPMARDCGLYVIADAAPADVELVRSFGASVIIERGDGFAARVRAAHPSGVDALLDTALLGDAAIGAVRDGGHVIAVRAWNGGQERDIRITPILVGYYAKNQQAMLEIRDLAERGVLKPRVADVLELADGADAQRRTEAGGLRGRIVLHLPD